MAEALSIALIGAGGMGRWVYESACALPDFEGVAVADPSGENRAKVEGSRGFADAGEMLAEVRPDCVIIATPNDSHAALAIRAVEAGCRGIFLEKPMAVTLSDARRVVAVCLEAGAVLVVNHQRRTYPALIKMREIIDSGAIGELELIRACGAGDFLSDGTHAVDSVKWLAGDRPAEWVYGSVFRRDHPMGEGVRYGHIVEDAAIGVVGFAGGLRAEFMWGELFPANRWYQDYEVIGSKGRLHRPPDGSPLPPLLLNGEPVDLPEEGPSPLEMFAETVRTGALHPMSGHVALEDMEIVTALYLSAHLREKVTLPFESDQFPLELIYPDAAVAKIGGI